MASFTLPIRSPVFNMSVSNGESSKNPNRKIDTGSPNSGIKVESINSSIKIESPDYPPFASAHPSFATIPDYSTLAIASFIKTESPQEPNLPAHSPEQPAFVPLYIKRGVPHDPFHPTPYTPEELQEFARLAHGLALKAAADKMPHMHYPSTDTNIIASSAQRRRDRKNDRRNEHRAGGARKPHHLAHLKIFMRAYHCKDIAPRAPGDKGPLVKFYSKRYFEPQTGHFGAPGREARPKSRTLRYFYARAFLAGPDEKTEVGDERVFYQRKFVCRQVLSSSSLGSVSF